VSLHNITYSFISGRQTQPYNRLTDDRAWYMMCDTVKGYKYKMKNTNSKVQI